MMETMDDFVEQVEKEMALQKKEAIDKIALKLLKKDEEERMRELQSECNHTNYSYYNHGYHKVCNECGEEL